MSQAPHLRVLAAKLQDCLLGRGPKRLIVSLPPRSLKSISISVAATAWLLGRDPTKHIICASYGQDLADKLARDARTICASSFFQKAFPGTRLSKAKSAISDFSTTRQGSRMATSVNGVLTGRGADIIVIDDPLKPDDALSITQREAVNDWYDSTLLSRLNNKEEGIIIIVMQRLHQDDLVGHVLERGDEWEVLSFSAIAETPTQYFYENASGTHVFERAIGDVLDISRESLATLLKIKLLIGAYNFASQYQQKPCTSRWRYDFDGLATILRSECAIAALHYEAPELRHRQQERGTERLQCVHDVGSLRRKVLLAGCVPSETRLSLAEASGHGAAHQAHAALRSDRR